MPALKFKQLWGDYFDGKKHTAALNATLEEIYRLINGGIDNKNVKSGGISSDNLAPGAVDDASLSDDQPSKPSSISVTTGIKADTGLAFIDVTWVQPGTVEVKKWEVRWRRQGETLYEYNWTGNQSIRIEGLFPNVAYEVGVQSISRTDIQSGYALADTTITTAVDINAPAQVTGLFAGIGLKSVTLWWTPSIASDLSHYEVQLATNSSFTTGLRTNQAKVTVSSFTDLVQGTTYWVRVAAVDLSDNKGAYSASVSFVPGLVSAGDIIDDAILGRHISEGAVGELEVSDFAITYRKFNNPDHYVY